MQGQQPRKAPLLIRPQAVDGGSGRGEGQGCGLGRAFIQRYIQPVFLDQCGQIRRPARAQLLLSGGFGAFGHGFGQGLPVCGVRKVQVIAGLEAEIPPPLPQRFQQRPQLLDGRFAVHHLQLQLAALQAQRSFEQRLSRCQAAEILAEKHLGAFRQPIRPFRDEIINLFVSAQVNDIFVYMESVPGQFVQYGAFGGSVPQQQRVGGNAVRVEGVQLHLTVKEGNLCRHVAVFLIQIHPSLQRQMQEVAFQRRVNGHVRFPEQERQQLAHDALRVLGGKADSRFPSSGKTVQRGNERLLLLGQLQAFPVRQNKAIIFRQRKQGFRQLRRHGQLLRRAGQKEIQRKRFAFYALQRKLRSVDLQGKGQAAQRFQHAHGCPRRQRHHAGIRWGQALRAADFAAFRQNIQQRVFFFAEPHPLRVIGKAFAKGERFFFFTAFQKMGDMANDIQPVFSDF